MGEIANQDITMIDADAPGPAPGQRLVTFESFALNSTAIDPVPHDPTVDDRFDWNLGTYANKTIIDNAHVFSGTKSAKLIGTQGSQKLGDGPGFNWTDNTPMVLGDEFRLRFKIFIEPSFLAAGGHLDLSKSKFLRFSQKKTTQNTLMTMYLWPNTGGSNVPSPTPVMHWAVGTGGNGKPNGFIVFYAPGAPNNGQIIAGWNTYEIYAKIGHSLATSSLRVWKDNFPCKGWERQFPSTFVPLTAGNGYDFQFPFINDPASNSDGSEQLSGAMHYFTQWNGNPSGTGLPHNVDTWVDNFDFTLNTVPANTDPISGFPFIGGA